MPNWCSNTLKIWFDPSELKYAKKLKRAINRGTLLKALVPFPRYKKGTEKYIAFQKEGWYNWCLENWGSKWDISNSYCDLIINKDDSSMIDSSFDTAWSPPLIAISAISQRFKLTYFEGGVGFMGEFKRESIKHRCENNDAEIKFTKGTDFTNTEIVEAELDRMCCTAGIDKDILLEYNMSEMYTQSNDDEDIPEEVVLCS